MKERTWPNNVSFNEYCVANLTDARKTLIQRQLVGLPDTTAETHVSEKETLLLTIQYANAEIASLLALAEGEKVVIYRERERRANKAVTVISGLHAAFGFAEVLPELEQAGSDAYQFMWRISKQPARWTETMEVVLARSMEHVLFELSQDDPEHRGSSSNAITFDAEDHTLAVQFLTIRGDRCTATINYATDNNVRSSEINIATDNNVRIGVSLWLMPSAARKRA